MTVSEVIIDLLDNRHDDYSMADVPIVEYLPVTPCPTVTVQAPGAPEPPGGCPGIKYSGDTITLKATPANGIGPYYVEFKKNTAIISSSRLGGLSNPITDAPEDVQITRVYTLNDLDISSASTGTINFSVYISDSCPTGAKYCESVCTVTIGCIAPVCNFTVT